MLGAIWNYTSTTDNLPSFDVAVAFERLYLFSYDKNRSLEVFARQSSICRTNSEPVVLVHYIHQFTLDAAVTTKGLGQALGAREDGDNNNCSSSDHYLMSANSTDVYTLNSTNPYYFSTCSVQYFHNYTQLLLGGGDQSSRSCLLDALPVYNVTNVTGILPGELYDPDAQCRLVYGAQSYYCFDTRTLGHKDICKRLNCYHPPSGNCYFLYGAEGTSCGNKKWCESGECLYSEDAPVTDDVCIHGDQGGRFDCDIMMAYYPYYCYYSNVQVLCCQSCKNVNVTDEGCPYGDNNYAEGNCTLAGCNMTSYMETCCETCASFRTTTTLTTEEIPLTTPTTTATTTTIPSSTMTTSTEKTTHSSTESFIETPTSTTPSTLSRKTSSNMPTFFSPTSHQSPEPSSTNEFSSGSQVTEEVSSTKTDASVTLEEHPTTEKTNVEENSLLDPTKIGLAVGLAVSVLVTTVVICILIKVRKTTKSADIHVTEWNNLQHLS